MFLHITPFLNTKHRSRTVVLNNLRVSQRNFFIVKKKKKLYQTMCRCSSNCVWIHRFSEKLTLGLPFGKLVFALFLEPVAGWRVMGFKCGANFYNRRSPGRGELLLLPLVVVVDFLANAMPRFDRTGRVNKWTGFASKRNLSWWSSESLDCWDSNLIP